MMMNEAMLFRGSTVFILSREKKNNERDFDNYQPLDYNRCIVAGILFWNSLKQYAYLHLMQLQGINIQLS